MTAFLIALGWLLVLLSAGRLFALVHGARDSDAGRRFRELSTKTLSTATDAERNRRWHREGATIRAAESFVVAVAVTALAGGSWLAFLCAWLAAGSCILYCFDRDFARKFGQDVDHLGTTSTLDVLALQVGRFERYELAVMMAGALGWLASFGL